MHLQVALLQQILPKSTLLFWEDTLEKGITKAFRVGSSKKEFVKSLKIS